MIENNKRISASQVIFVVCICITIIAAIYNIKVNCNNFFTVSLVQILTLFVAVYVAYYLVQKNNRKVQRTEQYIKVLEKIQTIASDKSSYIINADTNINIITMHKRTLSNCLGIIDKYSCLYNVENDVHMLKEHMNEYSEFLGNHISDVDYLSRSAMELKRPLDLIVTECYEIMLKVYG